MSMTRYMFPRIAGVAGILLLTLALAIPVAAARTQVAGSWSGAGDPVSIEQARERGTTYLEEIGLQDLAVGEVMEFSNQFYVAVVDPVNGDSVFELLVSPDGQSVHPEPTIMWNAEYNPMLGGRGAALHRGMMGRGMRGGMMDGGMGHGMAGFGDTDGHRMMGSMPESGRQLDQPLTADETVVVAQDWLDANRTGLTASEPISFPGYVTLHMERDGQIVGMLSVQTETGATWEHTWHGEFIGIDHGA